MKSPVCILVLLVLAMPGCQRGPGEPGRGGAGEAAKPAAQSQPGPARPSAGWKIELQAPPEIPANKPVELTARIFDAEARPLTGARVEVSLKMTTMDMGENKAVLGEKEPGIYAGKATFTMAGPWEVEVLASQGGKSDTRTFRYTAK